MKNLLLLIGLLFTTLVNAQAYQWQYVEDFKEANAPHGVLVDNDGKIWVVNFNATDSLTSANGDTTYRIGACQVFNPDGSEVSFSPILSLTVGADTDTLQRCRGLSLDHNGNVLYTDDVHDGPTTLYRINSQTGEGMNKIELALGSSATKAAADDNGFIYIAGVVPGGTPIEIYDENFDLYNFAVDSNFTISRALLVSPDGKDIYLGGIYPAAGAIHFHSDDGPDGQYTIVDTLLGPDPTKELWGQILNWDPAGRIWIGSYWDSALNAYQGWYALKTDQNNVFVDSLGYNLFPTLGSPVGNPNLPAPLNGFWAPRGISFQVETNGSWTAYTADFDGNVIKKWTNANPVGIIEVDNGVAIIKDFELEQNYPNPFNPTTKIPFALKKAAHVKLLVYNVSGQLVKTLVNETMQPGTYEYDFDARGLASGTYFYRISFDGKLQTRKMMFTK